MTEYVRREGDDIPEAGDDWVDPRRADGRCLHASMSTPVIPGQRGYVCPLCAVYSEDDDPNGELSVLSGRHGPAKARELIALFDYWERD